MKELQRMGLFTENVVYPEVFGNLKSYSNSNTQKKTLQNKNLC